LVPRTAMVTEFSLPRRCEPRDLVATIDSAYRSVSTIVWLGSEDESLIRIASSSLPPNDGRLQKVRCLIRARKVHNI
jgi:hypothetical protein